MQIGALSFRPYIYNTNMLNSRSLSKVSSIGDDLLASKTDFSALTEEGLNENPLKRGQSVNFVDILDRQMQMGRANASRLIKPYVAQEEQVPKAGAAQTEQAPKAGAAQAQVMPMDINPYRMQQAAEAYQVNMTA